MSLLQRRQEVLDEVLLKLNANQLEAVTADIGTPLQIIAGPGTGKTAVLTARVLYLLLEHQQDPHHIIVTTFTKRAANEMRERLQEMIPSDLHIDLNKLLIGTFHSICSRLLRQNGYHIGLPRNFKIADERDSKEVLKRVLDDPSKELSDLTSYMEELRKSNSQGDFDVIITQNDPSKCNGYAIDKIKRLISSLKSSGISLEDYGKSLTKSLELSQIYSEYQHSLSKSYYLDFDDILVYTRQLLKAKNCLGYISHVLVDEFQDTNEIQLELVYLFSSQSQSHCDNVTIVGDPDQSIYAFRNAVAENFDRMRHHYGELVNIIFLNQNYRSTKSVLQISETLMKQEQETGRIPKELQTVFSHDVKVVRNRFDTNKSEAEFIAREISNLLKFPNLFERDDFAILLRNRFHSRVIEQSLRRHNILYQVLQGRAFWDLKEIQMIIDYMRCIVSESDRLPYMRVINVPPRGVGTKSLDKLNLLIEQQVGTDDSILQLLENLNDGDDSVTKSFSNSAIKGITNFVNTVKTARHLLVDGTDLANGINKMFEYLILETNVVLRIRPEDPMTTENNLKEFKREVLEFEIVDRSLPDPETGEFINDIVVEKPSRIQFLSDFIESIDLYEKELEDEDEKSEKSKVIISTIHGAKGLEWPVVFVPNLTETYFPASWALKFETSNRSEAKNHKIKAKWLNEERRALYVAMTRAKISLYLNGFSEMIFGEEELEESRFMKGMEQFCKDRNEGVMGLNRLKEFYALNKKTLPDKKISVLKKMISMYNNYHDSEKGSTNKYNLYSPVKTSPVKGGNIIRTAASILKTSKPFTQPQKRKAPKGIRSFTQDHSLKRPATTTSTTTIAKKSFAPTYVYNKRLFK